MRDRDDEPPTIYDVSIAWLTRRVALAHLAYHPAPAPLPGREPALDHAPRELSHRGGRTVD